MRNRSHSYSIALTPLLPSQILSSCVLCTWHVLLFQLVTVTGINGGMSQDLAVPEELEGRGCVSGANTSCYKFDPWLQLLDRWLGGGDRVVKSQHRSFFLLPPTFFGWYFCPLSQVDLTLSSNVPAPPGPLSPPYPLHAKFWSRILLGCETCISEPRTHGISLIVKVKIEMAFLRPMCLTEGI